MSEQRFHDSDGLKTQHTKNEGLKNFVFQSNDEVSSTIVQYMPQSAYWFDLCPSNHYCTNEIGNVIVPTCEKTS